MKTSAAFFGILLVASSVLADPYSMAMQQAKRTSAQNNAEQQRLSNASGGASASAAAPSAPAVNPALQATLSNITSLQGDLKTIGSSATPDASAKVSLLNDLTSAAQGTKASSDSIKKLADDLTTAVSGKNQIPAAKQTQVARAIHAMFNSAHLTDAQQQALLDNVQKTLTDSGVSQDSTAGIVTDLKAIAAQTK
jgi:hypothetical protein